MAEPWKTEYHLLDPNGQAQEWFEESDEAAAIKAAQRNGPGWSVEEVTSYLDDRKTIWPSDEADA